MRERGGRGGRETGRKLTSRPAPPSHPPAPPEEPPPFGGSWRALYALVLLWLAAQVALFYLFTEAFR